MKTLQMVKIVETINGLEDLIEEELTDGSPAKAEEYIRQKEKLESKLAYLQTMWPSKTIDSFNL